MISMAKYSLKTSAMIVVKNLIYPLASRPSTVDATSLAKIVALLNTHLKHDVTEHAQMMGYQMTSLTTLASAFSGRPSSKETID
jgi:hypothetical protein